jgi:hypothetical protein
LVICLATGSHSFCHTSRVFVSQSAPAPRPHRAEAGGQRGFRFEPVVRQAQRLFDRRALRSSNGRVVAELSLRDLLGEIPIHRATARIR